jgi:hypothetical protein
MEVSEEASECYIDDLAQAVPFRFVDRVRFLDDSRAVTELRACVMPYRFVDLEQVDTYAILEFAAQSSGLILRGRKKEGGRGVITSFTRVERKKCEKLDFPLRLESRLVEDRRPLFEFSFQVHAGSELVFVGNVGIFIRR